MAVLVTGGAGYIGSHMVYELLENGHTVVVLDDLSTGEEWLVPKTVPFFIGKCGDASLVKALISAFCIDTIFHFAASIVVPESVEKPFSYYENNTAESRTLFETAVQCGVRKVVFSSSAAVYGDAGVSPIKEDTPARPTSPYGSSKLMTEIMLADAARAHGLSYVALRYFNVAGADPRGRTGQSGPNATHVIKVAVQTALGVRDGMSIFGNDYPTEDGTCIRDYVHVTDLVRAHAAALKHLDKNGDCLTLNVGYGHGFSVLEVVEAVRRVSGVKFNVKIAPRRAGDPAELIAANERITKILKWQPAYDDLDRIVKHALNWEEKLIRRKQSSIRLLSTVRLSPPSSNRTTPAEAPLAGITAAAS